jgi:hypothetical protein
MTQSNRLLLAAIWGGLVVFNLTGTALGGTRGGTFGSSARYNKNCVLSELDESLLLKTVEENAVAGANILQKMRTLDAAENFVLLEQQRIRDIYTRKTPAAGFSTESIEYIRKSAHAPNLSTDYAVELYVNNLWMMADRISKKIIELKTQQVFETISANELEQGLAEIQKSLSADLRKPISVNQDIARQAIKQAIIRTDQSTFTKDQVFKIIRAQALKDTSEQLITEHPDLAAHVYGSAKDVAPRDDLKKPHEQIITLHKQRNDLLETFDDSIRYNLDTSRVGMCCTSEKCFPCPNSYLVKRLAAVDDGVENLKIFLQAPKGVEPPKELKLFSLKSTLSRVLPDYRW